MNVEPWTIVRLLAKCEPPIYDTLNCVLCGRDIFGNSDEEPAGDLTDPSQHYADCPWRLARESMP